MILGEMISHFFRFSIGIFFLSNGDSGQPLLHVNTETMPAHWELVGIVSFGPSPCGQQSKPGVYTKISNYLEWILKNMS